MSLIAKIVSGGWIGVDRGAIVAARELGVKYGVMASLCVFAAAGMAFAAEDFPATAEQVFLLL